MCVAHGGQIVCHRHRGARPRRARRRRFVDLGEHRLRDLARAGAGVPGDPRRLPRDFPALRSLGRATRPTSRAADVVRRPRPGARVIGRALRRLAPRHAHRRRGVGKTRLASGRRGDAPRLPRRRLVLRAGRVGDHDDGSKVVATALGVPPLSGCARSRRTTTARRADASSSTTASTSSAPRRLSPRRSSRAVPASHAGDQPRGPRRRR